MERSCPRCGTGNPEPARFCRYCGLRLTRGPRGLLGAGQAPHPEPLDPPPGSAPVAAAAGLHSRWQASGGGKMLLGTEPLTLELFNGGYDLAEVVVRVTVRDAAGRELCVLEREIATLARGAAVALEIASYDLPGPVRALEVTLLRAEFARAGA